MTDFRLRRSADLRRADRAYRRRRAALGRAGQSWPRAWWRAAFGGFGR